VRAVDRAFNSSPVAQGTFAIDHEPFVRHVPGTTFARAPGQRP
jgi:hypothetical protein